MDILKFDWFIFDSKYQPVDEEKLKPIFHAWTGCFKHLFPHAITRPKKPKQIDFVPNQPTNDGQNCGLYVAIAMEQFGDYIRRYNSNNTNNSNDSTEWIINVDPGEIQERRNTLTNAIVTTYEMLQSAEQTDENANKNHKAIMSMDLDANINNDDNKMLQTNTNDDDDDSDDDDTDDDDDNDNKTDIHNDNKPLQRKQIY